MSAVGNSDPAIDRVENGLSPLVMSNDMQRWRISDRLDFYKVPGVSVAVVDNGEVKWAKGYGTVGSASDKAVTTETLFQIGSVGKMIAALTTLSLVSKGFLDLDKDVNLYLESWKVPENEYTLNEKATVRRILGHTAGFNDSDFEEYQFGSRLPTIPELLISNGIEIVKRPGEGYAYSGAGYIVLEQLIEDVVGKPYKRVAEEEVLKPLRMENTHFEIVLPDKLLKRAALAHRKDGMPYQTKYPLFPCFAPGTCNWSTATDMAQLFIEIQKSYYGESNRILPQTLAKEMMTQLTSTYGLGIKLIPENGSTLIGHSGDFYGFHAAVYGYLEKGKGIAVLTNGDNGVRLYNEIVRSVSVNYDWPGCKTENALNEKTQGIDLEGFCGCYYLPARMETMNIYLHEGKLLCDLLGHTGTELIQIASSKFFDPTNDGIIEFIRSTPGEHFDAEFRRIGVRMRCTFLNGFISLLTGDVEEGRRLILDRRDEYSQPQYNGILGSIGRRLLEKGESQKAITVLELEAALFPGSWKTYDSLGKAYMKAGDKELSTESYRKSLRLNPQNRNAMEKLEELRAVDRSLGNS